MAHLQISQMVNASRLDVYDYLSDPKNLPELLAPKIEVQLLTPDIPLKRGNEVHFMMSRFGFSQSVRLRIEDVLRGSRLSYRQSEGIFASWNHTIKFDECAQGDNENNKDHKDHDEDNKKTGTLVTDLVDYQVPMALVGHIFDDLILKRDMSRILAQRLLKAKNHFAML